MRTKAKAKTYPTVTVGDRVMVTFHNIPKSLRPNKDGTKILTGRVRGVRLRFPGSELEDVKVKVILDQIFCGATEWDFDMECVDRIAYYESAKAARDAAKEAGK